MVWAESSERIGSRTLHGAESRRAGMQSPTVREKTGQPVTAVVPDTSGIIPAARRRETLRFGGRNARTLLMALAVALAVSPFVTCPRTLSAAEPAARIERIDPDGIKGSLVICGGGKLPDAVRDTF